MDATNDSQTTLGTAPTGGDDPSTPPIQKPGTDTTDYKAAYKGLQPKYQQKETELQAAKSELETLRNAHNLLKAEMASLKEQTVTGLQTQVATLTADNKTLTSKVTLHTTIEKEFPSLVGLSELVPVSDDPAVMKQHLQAIQETWNKQLDTAVEKKARQMSAGLVPGGSPTVPIGPLMYNSSKEWEDAFNKEKDEGKKKTILDGWGMWTEMAKK